MNPSFVTSSTNIVTSSIGDSLLGAIPLILTIFAALVALAVALKYILKWIGGGDMVDWRAGNSARNREYAAQIKNEELLSYGDKTQRIDNWL